MGRRRLTFTTRSSPTDTSAFSISSTRFRSGTSKHANCPKKHIVYVDIPALITYDLYTLHIVSRAPNFWRFVMSNRLLLCLALLTVLALPASAQTPSGEISGTVVDSSGSVL